MKPADIDWSMLRGALIVLIIVLVVGAALVASSWIFWERMDKQASRLERELRNAKREWMTIDDRKNMIATYLPLFEDLSERGIIGREFRLDWIETLTDARERLKIPDLEYVIKAQEPYVPEFSIASGVYQPFASVMTIDAGLLHEGDLVDLLRALDTRARGLYSVKSCSIDRRRDTPGRPTEPHLGSNCDLEWFTLKNPRAEEAPS